MACCKGCGAPLMWIKTPAGKAMPCEATPMFVRQEPKSARTYYNQRGELIAGQAVSLPDEGCQLAYAPHWGNCPARDDFARKRRRA